MTANVQRFLQFWKSVLLLPGLSLSKGISMSLYSKAPVIFDGMELKLSSDMSMRFYSVAEIEESAMLHAVFTTLNLLFPPVQPKSKIDVDN